jgi:hypothetical protein
MAEAERRRQRAGGRRHAACGVRFRPSRGFGASFAKPATSSSEQSRDPRCSAQAARRMPHAYAAICRIDPLSCRTFLALPRPPTLASSSMPLFRVFRTPPRWLRAMLLVMALGFALNSAAHASHSHDVTSAAAQHLSCGYCVHLGAFADGPKHAHAVAPLSSSERLEAQAHTALRSRVPELAAQPRAPPSL